MDTTTQDNGGAGLKGPWWTRAGAALDRWFVVALLAASLGLNVYQALHSRVPASVSGARKPAMKIGDVIPAIGARDLTDRDTTITWASDPRPTVLYVFTPTCSWCARNLPNILAMSRERSADYRFIGLSLTAAQLKEYVAGKGIPFPVYARVADDSKEPFVGGTPTTLLISPDGHLKEQWVGAYSPRTQKEIEAKLHIKLPGLTDPGHNLPPG